MRRDDVVLVVDDDRRVRNALGSLLRSAGFKVELFGSAQEVLERSMPDCAHCLVLDVYLPGLSGLDLQARLAEEGAGTPIIFITGRGDIPTSVRAMKAGALEFLMKPVRDTDLLDAVTKAIEQSAARRAGHADVTTLRQRYARLTARQREVMLLVTNGLPNKRVAAQLGITEVMVKVHRRQVMKRMTAASLPELVRMVDKLRLRTP